jgi:hypothetical protein
LLSKLGVYSPTAPIAKRLAEWIIILILANRSASELEKLIDKILAQPRPDLDPNAANTANPGLDEAIDQLLRDNRIPGIEAIPNPDFDPNNVNQPGNTPVIPLPDTGNRNPELPDVTDRFDHRIRDIQEKKDPIVKEICQRSRQTT